MRNRIRLVAIGLLALIAAGLFVSRCNPAAPEPEIATLIGPHIGLRIGPVRPSGTIVAVIGDSNAVGQMDVGKAAAEFAVTTPTATPYDMFSSSASNEPVTMTEFGPTTLRSYGVSPGAGFELTLGRTLLSDIGREHYLLKMGISGTTTGQWAPGSSYGQSSPQLGSISLYTAWRNRVRSFVGSTGRTLGAVVVNLGTNDAADSTAANAVSANMAAIVDQIHADFGAGVVVVWIETHTGTTNTFTSTVRTQQTTYAGTAPATFRLVNIDDGVLLGDGLHYDADTYLTIGARAAFAVGDLLGIARRTVAVTPAQVGYGTAAFGSGNVTPRFWPGTQAGDTVYAYAHVAGLSVTGTPPDWTPSGWTLSANATSASSGVTIQYALFEKQLSSGDIGASGRPTSPTFATPGPESVAQLFTWRGPNPRPSIDAVQAFTSNTLSTGPVSPTGLTTTADHDSIAYFVGGWSGSTIAAAAAVTAATGVTSVVEVKDSAYSMPDTAGGLVTLTTGEMATHTTIGTPSVTFGINTIPAIITAAVKP